MAIHAVTHNNTVEDVLRMKSSFSSWNLTLAFWKPNPDQVENHFKAKKILN